MSSIVRKCIVCKKTLEPVHETESKDIFYPPNGGIYLHSRGNYGSEVFDPVMKGEMLECYVCDECLIKNWEDVYVIEYVSKPPETKYKTLKEYNNA